MSDFNLPEGWLLAKFGDLNSFKSSIINPDRFGSETFELFSVPIFPTKKPEIVSGAEIGSSKQLVDPKDILLCKINPRINRVWRVSNKGQLRQIASSEWIVFRQQLLNENFVLRYFQSSSFRDLLCSDVTGVGGSLTRAQPKNVVNYLLPLAPLAEQQQIAQKLDELLAQVDTLKTRLDAIPNILKRFRQSVLAAAVSGRLTEEWRESDEYELKGNKYLPLSWKSEQAQNVCLKVQSGSTPRDNPFDQNGSIPFLKVYNIVNQKIDFNYKPQFVTAEVHEKSLKRSIALPNDILMNIVGPPLGKVAVLTNQYPEWNLNQAITLFRTNPDHLQFMYLYYVLCEGELVRDVMPETKGSVGQVNISLSQCRDALIPVPPLEEQTEIVRRVEQLFAYADQIEQRVKDAQARVNHLTQSILAKAFRGELTAEWRAQNPELISGENSAAALLERIKAEREAVGKTKRKVKAGVAVKQ